MNFGRYLVQAFALAGLASMQLIAGCQTVPAARKPPRPLPQVTCAARLHDLSGVLLQYYALNRRLPEKLEELRSYGDIDMPVELSCPDSGKPYIYNPQGIVMDGTPGRAIIYDAEPSHAGLGLGIFIIEPRAGGSVATKVLPIPADRLTIHPSPGP